MNKETFKLIKSIEAAQSSPSHRPNNRNILRYLSASYIRSTFADDSHYTTVILNSLFLLRLGSLIYFINLITVSAFFFLKFQLFSIFSLAFALLILFLAPTIAFFTSHYPLIYSATTRSSSFFFKFASVFMSFAGFTLQSICWCFTFTILVIAFPMVSIHSKVSPINRFLPVPVPPTPPIDPLRFHFPSPNPKTPHP